MSRRVLVVDDDLDIRDMICEYFRGRGWEAVGVGTVAEGLAALESPVDGLIVDQRLPDRDGSALVREAAQRGLAVLAITAYPTVEEALELLSAGANTLIPKPFRLKAMLERLELAIQQRQAEREQRQRLRGLAWLEEVVMAERAEHLDVLEAQLREMGDVSVAWTVALAQARFRIGGRGC